MAETLLAGLYAVKRDEDDNLLIFLPQPDGIKDNPVILYDGGEHALFSRNRGQNIVLDYVNPEMRRELSTAAECMVAEVRGQNVADHYRAVVRHVDNIPVDWQKFGLTTWAEKSGNNNVGEEKH